MIISRQSISQTAWMVWIFIFLWFFWIPSIQAAEVRYEWMYISSLSKTYSLYGGFLKWWYPQITHFNRVFHYKPSILGYHYLRKHPYMPFPKGKDHLPTRTFQERAVKLLGCIGNLDIYIIHLYPRLPVPYEFKTRGGSLPDILANPWEQQQQVQ